MDLAAEEQKFLEALEKGIELFDRGAYLTAYEVWEDRWNQEVTEGADLLQGLLQVAVAFAKLHDGNARAAVKLLDKGAAKLQIYRPTAYDLDIDALLGRIVSWRNLADQALQSGEAPPEPTTLFADLNRLQ